MDPDANLAEQRRIVARVLKDIDDDKLPDPVDAARLVELNVALDEWIARGGALPKAWKR